MSFAFAHALKRYRKEVGYSLRELSSLSGVDSAYISRLERGVRFCPSLDIVNAIVAALDLPVRDQCILKILHGTDVSSAVIDNVIDNTKIKIETLLDSPSS